MPDNPEFSFHVHKLMGNAQRPSSFTIAIWEGTVLRGICYAQPLDAALAAFCKVLDEWGRQPMGKEVCRQFSDEVAGSGCLLVGKTGLLTEDF